MDRVLFAAILAYFAILGAIYAFQSIIMAGLGDFDRLIMVAISSVVLIPVINGLFQSLENAKNEEDDDEFGHTRDPRI